VTIPFKFRDPLTLTAHVFLTYGDMSFRLFQMPLQHLPINRIRTKTNAETCDPSA